MDPGFRRDDVGQEDFYAKPFRRERAYLSALPRVKLDYFAPLAMTLKGIYRFPNGFGTGAVMPFLLELPTTL
jgi:hypothetical protein